MPDVISAFLAAMAKAGIIPDGPIDFVSGKLHRFRAKGDKHGRANGWAVLHLDALPCGAFGHWRLGIHEKWRFDPAEAALSPAQMQAHLAQVQENEAKRAKETLCLQVETAGKASYLWASASEADFSHPYLVRKRIPPVGVRQLGDILLVPLVDTQLHIWNLQRIWPDGTKRFLKGGRTAGLFWMDTIDEGFGTEPSTPLVIGEGYATMVAIRSATAAGVVATMSASNLMAVACDMRALFPTRRLIIAADNDAHLTTNVGVEAARKAASAAGAALVIPEIG